MIRSTPEQPFERRFLHLATWALACNYRAMGGRVQCAIPTGNLDYELLGMYDHFAEMRLICRKEKLRCMNARNPE